MSELVGQIERITFTNEENGYTVARLTPEEGGELVTIVGHLPESSPGTMLRLRGEWVQHPKFGRQFKIEGSEAVAPRTPAAIERYLAAGAVKGIGPATAKQIVSAFGAETLQVLDQEIERLRSLPGIGKKRLAQISRSWEGQKATREVMLFLEGNGVSPAYAARIYRRYGAAAISIVKRDPYRLANDIAGIGFATADRIAETLGAPRDSPQRAQAGLLFALERSTAEGHLFLPAGELLRRGEELLALPQEQLEPVLAALLADGRRIVADPSSPPSPASELPVYLPELLRAEQRVAARLRALAAAELPPRERLQPASGGATRLSPEQLRAVTAALSQGLTVITGGPGTGKTTIIALVVRSLAAAGRRLLLAAPTGRAAKRMSEATGWEAKTLHRLLEVDPAGGGFRRNGENPLECDALIVDEISMVDLPLMAALLEGLPPAARLILVGDADQLPSVGPGNLLADLIASGVIPVSRLTEVYRQASGSRIISGAHEIIEGRIPSFSEDASGDFYFIEQEEPERVVSLIETLVSERIPRGFGFDPVDEIQVLTPVNRTPTGTLSLNAALQGVLNPAGPELQRSGRTLRREDKVMQTRNNYDLDVFNGDIGRIVAIDPEAGDLEVDFDGRRVAYSSDHVDELSLAYAVTVHKSQGSEFPAVVMPILAQHYLLLQRNLLYTAVTRGKRLFVLVGSRKALSMAIANDRPLKRNSLLMQRLRAD